MKLWVASNAITLTAALSVFSLIAAENKLTDFTGTWKEDLSKAGNKPPATEVITYRQNPDGSMTQTTVSASEKQESSFRIDGEVHPQPGAPGYTLVWTATGPSSWERKLMKNGDLVSNNSRVVSADGKSLTLTTRRHANGLTAVETKVYERTSGAGRGLAGTWKVVSVTSETPDVMELWVFDDGTIAFHELVPDYHFSAKLDGNDYHITGAQANPKLRASFRQVGDRTIEQTVKNGDQPFEISTWTLSSDGRSIAATDKVLEPGGPVVTTSVYLRQ